MLTRTLLSETNADVNMVHAESAERSYHECANERVRNGSPALLTGPLSLSMGRPNPEAVANRLLKYCVCMSITCSIESKAQVEQFESTGSLPTGARS